MRKLHTCVCSDVGLEVRALVVHLRAAGEGTNVLLLSLLFLRGGRARRHGALRSRETGLRGQNGDDRDGATVQQPRDHLLIGLREYHDLTRREFVTVDGDR